MKQLLKKPYLYFWLTAVIVLMYRYLILIKIGDSALDINVHDTYFVISHWHITIVICLFYLILGLIYFLFEIFKIKLNIKLIIIHTIITVLSVLSYPLGKLYYQVNDYPEFPLFNTHAHIGKFNNFLFILILVAQLFLAINIFISILKRFSHKN